MDRRRALAALLIASTCVAGVCVAASPSAEFPIREARWVAPEARLDVLNEMPSACLAIPSDAAAFRSMMTGMAAFRTPLLLGGQAARAGMSCNSCHVNGTGNTHFRFPGLSGADGTADVTSSIMSSHRGDRVFNPKTIPDLATGLPQISRDPGSPALRTFIRGLVVEEFDGPEPSPATLDGLAAYVRALGGKMCRTIPSEAASSGLALTEATGILWLANAALESGDAATAALMVGSARSTLGRAYERFADPSLASERVTIERLDDDLRAIREGLGRDKQLSLEAILTWSKSAEAAKAKLAAAEPRSLYNREKLSEALKH
jgi:hypothetical protein